MPTPPNLPYLFCTPQNVYELVGIEPAQLRLDDQNQASGQSVQTTSAASAGATSIAVSALQYGLLKGTNLVFSDAGMDTPVEATLSAAANVSDTSISVTALGSAIASGAIAKDNGVNVWLAGLMSKACVYGTDRVRMYCLDRYDDNVLINSWTVNQWATKIAAYWLAKRLYRSAPQGIKEDYDETMEELKAVQANELNIAGLGTRTSGWPAFSNVTIDLVSDLRRVKVEPLISEPTQTQYPQAVDWNSYYSLTW